MVRIPVILCVDVEPDGFVFPPENPSSWRGFELFVERVRLLRPKLEEATGETARISWSIRMDPQVAEAYGTPRWAADRFRPLFDELRARGDALGVHAHAWRWDRSQRVWVTDHADQVWINRCVEMAVEAYREAFGQIPPYHRFGARFMSTATMNLLRTLGIRIDLTVEPGEPPANPVEGVGGTCLGENPDFTFAPRVPYRPDPSNFLRPAQGSADDLWAVPLSSGRLALKPHRLRRAWTRRLRQPVQTARRVVGRVRSTVAASPQPQLVEPQATARPPHRSLAMEMDWRSPADFWDSAFQVVEELERPYLAFAVRSDLPTRRDRRRIFDGIFRYILDDPRAQRLVFTTPEDCLRRLGLEKHEAQAH